MKYNLFFIFILFVINNLLHHISEKVVIITFMIIFFLLTKVLNSVITESYNSRLRHILNDINTYINLLFILFYNKKNSFYFNLALNSSFKKLSNLLLNYSKKLIKKEQLNLINSKWVRNTFIF